MGNCRGDPGAGKELGRAGDNWHCWENSWKAKFKWVLCRSCGCPWHHLIALARKMTADCPLNITLIRLDFNGCRHKLNTSQLISYLVLHLGANWISEDDFVMWAVWSAPLVNNSVRIRNSFNYGASQVTFPGCGSSSGELEVLMDLANSHHYIRQLPSWTEVVDQRKDDSHPFVCVQGVWCGRRHHHPCHWSLSRLSLWNHLLSHCQVLGGGKQGRLSSYHHVDIFLLGERG